MALREVVELHRQHQHDTHDDHTRAGLVSAVREMEWAMQDLEDYGQSTELSDEALDFQRETRATILEVRQTLASAAAFGEHQSDTDVRRLSLLTTQQQRGVATPLAAADDRLPM